MPKKESIWRRLNHLITHNLLLVIILVLAGWWLFSGDNPVRFNLTKGSVSYDYNEDMAMAEMAMPQSTKMMAYGRGGGIMPPIMENNFIPDAEDRKIVKNGSLDLEVTDTEKARTEAETIVTDMGGAITSLNSWETRPGVLAYNLTTRVPAEKLEEIVTLLTDLGIKKSENFNISDITAQYQDTENRLENLRARRDRLREMMDRKTDNLGDVLSIDRELANVQMEIENLERSQNRRDTDVAYSTLNLSLHPETQIGDVSNPHWNVTKSMRTAVNDLIQSSQGILDKLIKVLVYVPIWVPIVLILWFLDRKFLHRKK